MATATGLRAVEDRGYTKRDGFSFAIDNKDSSKGYLQSLMLDRDDCAMACDNEPDCKSFQVFTDARAARGFHRYCMLMHKDPNDVTLRTTVPEYTNVEVYSRPATKPNDKGDTRLFMLKNANPPGYKVFDGQVFSLDDGGLNYQPANVGPVTNYYSDKQETGRNVIYPTGILTNANFDLGLGDYGGDGIIQMHTGVKACNRIPGVVTNTVPTNLDGTGLPQGTGCSVGPDGDRPNCKSQDNVGLYCGYNKLDNPWILANWENLQSYLASTLGTEYKAPGRPDGKSKPQVGIFKVDSVKVAKGDYCNTVPFSELTGRDLRPITKCKEFKTQDGGSKDFWYQFILERAQKEDWRPTSNVIVEGCTDSKTTAVVNACAGAIGNLNVSEPLNPDVVLHVNEINRKRDQSPVITQAIQAKVDAYCEKHQNSLQCACRNAVKFGIANCKPGIPGCEDMVEFQKLRDVIEDNTALAEFIKGAEPRVISSACQRSDAIRENTIFQYGVPTGKSIELNNCILEVDNAGGTINDIYQKCYTKTQRNTGDGGGGGAGDGGGGGAGDDEEEGKTSSWVWILLIAVIFLSLIGVAGIGIFALS